MARSALNSAVQIAPGQPQRNGPWRCLLHFVMQAVTIMVLEISFGSMHMPEGENNRIELTKELRPLAPQDIRA